MRGLFDILWSFLKIGAFTFGGGYAMIPLIQHEVITTAIEGGDVQAAADKANAEFQAILDADAAAAAG